MTIIDELNRKAITETLKDMGYAGVDEDIHVSLFELGFVYSDKYESAIFYDYRNEADYYVVSKIDNIDIEAVYTKFTFQIQNFCNRSHQGWQRLSPPKKMYFVLKMLKQAGNVELLMDTKSPSQALNTIQLEFYLETLKTTE